MGPSQISIKGNVILGIDFWRRLWIRFAPTRVRAPQKVFFLISMEWFAEKGTRRSGSQVPVNTFVSLAACTSFPCVFSVTLHLDLRHFDCLSADFVSPPLFYSEASLWHWQISVVAEGSFHWLPHVSLRCFACPFADSLLLFHEAAFWQSIPIINRYQTIWKIRRWVLAMPKRYPFFSSRHRGAHQCVAT